MFTHWLLRNRKSKPKNKLVVILRVHVGFGLICADDLRKKRAVYAELGSDCLFSHHQRELTVIPQPKMLLADDFKAYSKLKVENHAFNRTSLPGHYKVKEYCPLVFRALRERFDVSEVICQLSQGNRKIRTTDGMFRKRHASKMAYGEFSCMTSVAIDGYVSVPVGYESYNLTSTMTHSLNIIR